MLSIEELAKFCKTKGLIYPNSEIYGGLAGFFDYGPLGIELKNNIKQQWWKFFVQDREDIVGIDGAIITHPKVWEASGHVQGFTDILVECKKCHERFRADQLIEDALKMQADGMKESEINILIKKHNLKCPKCKGNLSGATSFNLMFETNVGPKTGDESKAYLRPETAQLMFTNFRLIQETSRLKLPFGIAQIGKAFRNEISPRNFLFRCREFEQMEIEYFIKPLQPCPYTKEIENYKIQILSADMQTKKQKPKELSMKQALKQKIIKSEWHAYWLALNHKWFTSLGINKKNLRIRQHKKDELAHYSSDCWDLEYNFPFGWKELQGIADRSDYDLQQHIKYSKKDLSLFDEETKKKIVPNVVAEPSLGVDRTFLVFLYDAYEYSKKRGNVVLHLHPKIAPIKVGVFSLVNKLNKESEKLYNELKYHFPCIHDVSGSIGRRYARADEQGIPYCITIDFDCKKKKDVTLRNRETTKQVRVKQKDLLPILQKLLSQEIKFEKTGKSI